ncbi:MAG: zinc-binding dehydrogenase [Armatimonadota bacterium]
MRAVLQHGIHDIRIEETTPPVPAAGEVLIRVRAVTICASDLHIYSEGNVGGTTWDRPFVPGHEAAGIVEDANGTDLAVGTPVVLDPAAACFECDMCREGLYHLCRNLKFLDLPPVHGAMRELVAWPAKRAFPLPNWLDLSVAPLIEPLCVAVHALDLAAHPQGADVLVTGCGAVGLFVIQMAKIRGAKRVIASDLVPERLAAARELGADMTIDVSKRPPVAEVMAASNGRGVDIAFEAAGPHEALRACLEAMRPAGEVIVIGIPSEDEYRLKPSDLRRHEVTLKFVRRQNENYPAAIRLVSEKRIKLDRVLTHRFSIDRARDAFSLAERKQDGAIRVAVLP